MAIIEAVLFLSREALSLEQLAKICNVAPKEIRDSLADLRGELEKTERGLVLLATPQGYRLGTKPELAVYLKKMQGEKSPEASFSQAALETLAIIALKQPVTRVEIEKIRGVQAEGVLDNLLKRGLIEVTGRREGPGRPLLYGVTEEFLQYFGLRELKELEEELEDITF
ncbi:MAG: SMC-Scp complex subunit ScpB [Firmicutes bacterium]|nr:SMC-Scp complex subunit ScpB [Bacillota bacterium]